MRRFLISATGLLLLLLGTQAVLAEYGPAGTLDLSAPQSAPGGTVTISGSGYAPNSEVRITIESTPRLLATVTTDASGAFEASVTIPAGFSGDHRLVATGTDSEGSVRVLASTVHVDAGTLPITSAHAGNPPIRGSDGLILAIAAAGIVLLSGGLVLIARRAR